MWVKLTLPPWRRRRCPLRTLRLTSSSRAGTVRTEVAVGTSRLASIASTIRAAAPRSGTSWGSALPSPSEAALGCGLAGASAVAGALASGCFASAGASWGSVGRPCRWPGRPRPRPGPRRSPRGPRRPRPPWARSRRRSPARRGSPTPGCPGTGGRSRQSAQRWRRTPVVRTNPSAQHHPWPEILVRSSLPPMTLHSAQAPSRAVTARRAWSMAASSSCRTATMLVPARMADSSKASCAGSVPAGQLASLRRPPGASTAGRTHRSRREQPMPLVNVKLVERRVLGRAEAADRPEPDRGHGGDRGREHAPGHLASSSRMVKSGDWGIAGNPRVHRRRQGPGRRRPGRLTPCRSPGRTAPPAAAPARCRARGLAWRDGDGTFAARRARAVLSPDPRLVRGRLCRAHPGPGRRLGRPRPGPGRAGGRPHRVGQDPGRVPVGHRPPGRRPGGARARAPPGPVRLPAQGPGRRHRAQPPGAPGRPAGGRRPPGRAPARHHRRDAHRRHPGRGPPPLPGPPARHPHHHPRVAVPAAHLQGPRGPGPRRHGDRRRGPLGGRHQARGPSRPQPGAPGRAAGAAGPPHRPVGHRPPAGRGGPLPRRPPPGHGRGPAEREGVRPLGGRPGRGHGGHRRGRPTTRRPGRPPGCPTAPRSGPTSTSGWSS